MFSIKRKLATKIPLHQNDNLKNIDGEMYVDLFARNGFWDSYEIMFYRFYSKKPNKKPKYYFIVGTISHKSRDFYKGNIYAVLQEAIDTYNFSKEQDAQYENMAKAESEFKKKYKKGSKEK